MEKFYLDTMARTLAIKKIHFLITVIPLIYKLDNNYPLKKAHQYLKEFSNHRSIEFLDLYERGFKNLDADTLRISESDHHLNLEANTIVADTLFNKIKALTKYKNISYFNKAFSLKEFLEEKQILKEIDTLFNKKETIRTELERRNALTFQEWEMIDSSYLQVGMSELALWCLSKNLVYL